MIGWVVTPMISREATACSLLLLGLILGCCELPGILCIGSYIYHSDVIAVAI